MFVSSCMSWKLLQKIGFPVLIELKAKVSANFFLYFSSLAIISIIESTCVL